MAGPDEKRGGERVIFFYTGVRSVFLNEAAAPRSTPSVEWVEWMKLIYCIYGDAIYPTPRTHGLQYPLASSMAGPDEKSGRKRGEINRYNSDRCRQDDLTWSWAWYQTRRGQGGDLFYPIGKYCASIFSNSIINIDVL